MPDDDRVLRFYEDHAKTCDPKDFWRQVRRSVGGEPLGEDQINMIVDAVCSGLELAPDDVVLDLCCGNGALSDRIFEKCRGGLGVDYSSYLIQVARDNFEQPATRTYSVEDVGKFAAATTDTRRFSKALCYGSFHYLTAGAAADLLQALRSRFTLIRRLFIGNLPDRALLHAFAQIANGPDTPERIWRTEEEFQALAAASGWQSQFRRMPAGFHAAHYRYDAVLTPLGGS